MLWGASVAWLLCWGPGSRERLEVRVVRKYNKQTLCGRGSDLGRKEVAQSFPGSCTGGDSLSPALLTLAHALPDFGWSPVLWHNRHFPSQPSAQVPQSGHCSTSVVQGSQPFCWEWSTWHIASKHPWAVILSHKPLSTTQGNLTNGESIALWVQDSSQVRDTSKKWG